MALPWQGGTVDAVIFDHDGTLVDSENMTADLQAEMAQEIGVELSPEDRERFVGAQLRPVIEEILRRSPSDRYHYESFLAAFRERQRELFANDLQEIAGAGRVLAELADRGVPCAVASNAPRSKMELCLDTTGLRRFFTDELLVSAYEVGVWKPEPDIFLHAATLLGIAPDRCLVVEDSRPGMEAGKAAGMAVAVLDPDGAIADGGVVRLHRLGELLG
jgi:HAD superfamily hydrolase (TIGR01509 family)